MSIVISPAYRVSLTRLNGFIDSFHDAMWRATIDHIAARMMDIPKDLLGLLSDADWEKERWERFSVFFDRCVEAARSSRRSFGEGTDIESGINIWVRGRYAYCVPFQDLLRTTWDVPSYARDYSYWNNTDRPDNVSASVWRSRRLVWEKICLGSGKQGHNARRLYHPVVDLQTRNQFIVKSDLWESMGAATT